MYVLLLLYAGLCASHPKSHPTFGCTDCIITMLDFSVSPVDVGLRRRPASVCQFWRDESDLSDSPVFRCKSAVPMAHLPANSNDSFTVRRKSQTMMHHIGRTDSVTTQDTFCLAQQDDETAADSTTAAIPSTAGRRSSVSTTTAANADAYDSGVVDATAAVTVVGMTPGAANTLTPMQKLRSLQAEWGEATSQPWFHN